MLVATTKDGKTVSGMLVSKTASTYTLKGADGKTFQLSRSTIKSETLASPMPPMGLILQKREIRNLIEFLYGKPKEGYVRAEDFFSDPGRWRTLVGKRSKTLGKATTPG